MNNIQKTSLLIIFLSLSSLVYSCKCKTISKEKDFSLSKYVLTGDIIDVKKDSFFIKGIEFFKNQTEEILTVFIDNCSIRPKKGETWLLYIDQSSSKEYTVSHCGWSRNFEDPYCFSSNSIPPPKIPNSEKWVDWIIDDLYLKNNFRELENDILYLQNEKNKKSIKILQDKISDITLGGNGDSSINYIYLVLFSVIIILLIFRFKK